MIPTLQLGQFGLRAGYDSLIWSPTDKGVHQTLSNNNLTATFSSGVSDLNYSAARGRKATSSGKRQFEVTVTSNLSMVGVGLATANIEKYPGISGETGSWGYYGNTGNKYANGNQGAFGATYGSGDIIGVVVDGDNLRYYKNRVLQGTAFTGMSGRVLYPMVGPATDVGTFSWTINGGETGFRYPVDGAIPWNLAP